MIDLTLSAVTDVNLAPPKARSGQSCETSYRLLEVISGGEAILLRPDCIRGVYKIPVECLSSDLSRVPTPEGMIPSVSLAERTASELGLQSRKETTEQTVIVFHRDDRSVALRVHSVSRPVEVARNGIVSLPDSVRSGNTPSSLDSVAVVEDPEAEDQKRIELVVNPMVMLGFCDRARKLCTRNVFKPGLPKNANEVQVRDGLSDDSRSSSKQSALANAQLLAFSPRTPLPAHLFFRFCLPMSVVQEVLIDQTYISLPTANSILQGFLMWRAKPVPVIDLAMAFGAANDEAFPTQPGRILIAKFPGRQFVALPTELSIQTVRACSLASIDYPRIAAYPNFGAFSDGTDTLVLPDVNRILNQL